MSNHKDLQKLTASGLLISFGIIYGDISSLLFYAFRATSLSGELNFSPNLSLVTVLTVPLMFTSSESVEIKRLGVAS